KKFCNFSLNAVDVLRTGASEPSSIRANSEHARQFLVDRMGYGFTILSSTRLDCQDCLPGTGYIEAGERLNVEGTINIDGSPVAGATIFDLKRCRTFISTGIRFAPGTTREETGFDTMPLERGRLLVSMGHGDIAG